jgi:transglutaminase superfamily protein
MNKFLLTIVLLLNCILLATNTNAQDSNKDFHSVDDYIKKLGTLDTLNMGSISVMVTQHFPDKIDKVRAIFDWIADNIDFDCKAAQSSNNDLNTDDVLKYRKTTSPGYAALFQDMCSVAGIRCLTVDGYIKNSTDDINAKPDGFTHTWDVVQLGKSEEEWHYVDPMLGSGYTDKDMKTYTKAFNDNYFFANKTTFNLQCFPDNMAWQLDNSGPKNKKEFFTQPVVKDAAYLFDVSGYTPLEGDAKVKTGKPVRFTINVHNEDSIKIVSIRFGEDKRSRVKQMNYTLSDGAVSFNYTFADADTYPIEILINGQEVLDYIIEVND